MKTKRLCMAAGITAVCSIAIFAAQSAQAQTYEVLYTFVGGTDGANPAASVIRDTDGNFYGTTYFGGTANLGTVFKLDKSGKETVLHSFIGGTDGASPQAGVILDAEGNLYGTTTSGGGTGCGGSGCGVVFKVSKTGKEKVLHSFTGSPDGAVPYGGLILDSTGNLYGTTNRGRTGGSCARFGGGCGVVFKVSNTGKETVLFSFTDTYSSYPSTGVIHDAQGHLYGTAHNDDSGPGGTVYRLSPGRNGQYKETVLYVFTGSTDGSFPSGGLVRDANGNIYGNTAAGGDLDCEMPNGCGVVFKLSNKDKETVVYSFTGGSDGANPYGGMIQDAKGNFYGATSEGGGGGCNGSGCGTVFKLNQAGHENVLYSFAGANGEPDTPNGVIEDSKGNLYGTTFYGGDLSCGQNGYGCGVVFKLTP